MTELTAKHCQPCTGDTPPLGEDEIERLSEKVPDWEVTSGHKLVRRYQFDEFMEAVDFVNDVAELAEEEGHHPNMAIDYDEVTFTVWTHAIDDLSENDFILAAKIDGLYSGD